MCSGEIPFVMKAVLVSEKHAALCTCRNALPGARHCGRARAVAHTGSGCCQQKNLDWVRGNGRQMQPAVRRVRFLAPERIWALRERGRGQEESHSPASGLPPRPHSESGQSAKSPTAAHNLLPRTSASAAFRPFAIMASQLPVLDRDTLFAKLLVKKDNRACFDCGTANPKW